MAATLNPWASVSLSVRDSHRSCFVHLPGLLRGLHDLVDVNTLCDRTYDHVFIKVPRSLGLCIIPGHVPFSSDILYLYFLGSSTSGLFLDWVEVFIFHPGWSLVCPQIYAPAMGQVAPYNAGHRAGQLLKSLCGLFICILWKKHRASRNIGPLFSFPAVWD